jgi:hypothetical protein
VTHTVKGLDAPTTFGRELESKPKIYRALLHLQKLRKKEKEKETHLRD